MTQPQPTVMMVGDTVRSVAGMKALPVGTIVMDTSGIPAMVRPVVGAEMRELHGATCLAWASLNGNLTWIDPSNIPHQQPFTILHIPYQDGVEALRRQADQLRYLNERFPCSGCTDEPREECPAHGRTPSELWAAIDGLQATLEGLRAEREAGQ